MLGPRTGSTLRSVAAMVLGALIVLALPHPSRAQQPAVSAELTRVVGRVELLRKGQTQWIPAVIGAHLVEGDDIRAFSGAWAELVAVASTNLAVLPDNVSFADASTLPVAGLTALYALNRADGL